MQDLEKQLGALLEPHERLSTAQQRTRKRLLQAAGEHFARFGYRRTNISDIATEAGVGKGTVYLYFNSKIELLSACVAREKLELIPQLEQTMELPPAERLEAYLKIAIRFAVMAPLSSALMKGDRELSAALADAADEGMPADPTPGIALVGGLVADAAPGLTEHEREHLGQILLVVAALPAHLPNLQQFMDIAHEDFITTFARVLARGIAGYSPAETEQG